MAEHGCVMKQFNVQIAANLVNDWGSWTTELVYILQGIDWLIDILFPRNAHTYTSIVYTGIDQSLNFFFFGQIGKN